MLTLWRDIGRNTRWVMISYMLWGIGEGLWMFIQPLYLKTLGATPTQTGFVIGLWGLGRLLVVLPAGLLADRWGAHRLLIPGWYTGLTGVVIITLAPNWQWAAPGFLIYGLSAAAIPVTNLYVTQSSRYDPTRRPDLPLQTGLTLLWAAYSSGLVISPSIGGAIGDVTSLRTVYSISVFWFVLSTLAILRTHAYPVPPRPEHGYNYRGMLRQRPVFTALGLITLGFVAVLVGQTLSAQYLEEARDFSRTAIGAAGSLSALGTAVFSLALSRLSAWRGFFASLLLVLIAFTLLLSSHLWPVLMVAYFMLGAHYTTRPFANSVLGERVHEHQRGVAYALVDTLAGLATLIGTNLAGLLYAGHPGYPFAAGIAGITGVTILAVVLLRPPAHRNLPEAPAYSEAGVE